MADKKWDFAENCRKRKHSGPGFPKNIDKKLEEVLRQEIDYFKIQTESDRLFFTAVYFRDLHFHIFENDIEGADFFKEIIREASGIIYSQEPNSAFFSSIRYQLPGIEGELPKLCENLLSGYSLEDEMNDLLALAFTSAVRTQFEKAGRAIKYVLNEKIRTIFCEMYKDQNKYEALVWSTVVGLVWDAILPATAPFRWVSVLACNFIVELGADSFCKDF